MKNIFLLSLVSILCMGCKQEVPTEIRWVHQQTIELEGVNPIGIAQGDGGIWLSDGDHNRVVLVNSEGMIQKSIDSLDRPMHIDAQNEGVLVPQYGNDEVALFWPDDNRTIDYGFKKTILSTQDSLDAPAGVSFRESEYAIADFYNNRIHYLSLDKEWITFGKEGKEDGEFYYPTDVHITEDKIWVADAYNNRLQVFDKKGNHLKTIGEGQKMNAATGIFVSDSEVFSTDFENNRVLVFDLEGTFKQELKETIAKPTDMMIIDHLLYVTNYKGKSLSVFEQKELPVVVEEDHQDDHNHDH